MIFPHNSQYLTPTKKFRQLSILLTIHNSHLTSQSKIAEATHMSSSMVNNYIKRFKRDDLLTVTGNTNRTQHYFLTPSGYKVLTDALLSYSAEIVQIYASVKREIVKILERFSEEGICTLALFGAAETAEVVYAALKETDITVAGIFDSDIAKIGRNFNGFPIQPPERMKGVAADAVLITSYAKQEEMHSYIRDVIGQDIRIKTLSILKSMS